MEFRTSSSEASQPNNSSQQPTDPGRLPVGGYVYTEPPGGAKNGGLIPPQNYLTVSILVTVFSLLCCCSPVSVILGIIAITKASSVNPEFERGNMSDALIHAASAKKLTIWAAVISVICYIVYVILYFSLLIGTVKLSVFERLLQNVL
jgi:hypothetical protein